MKSKTRSLITILFLLAMLVCVCSITAFGDDGSVKVVAGAGFIVNGIVSRSNRRFVRLNAFLANEGIGVC